MSDKIIRVTISIDYQGYKYGDTVFFAPNADMAYDHLVTLFGEDMSGYFRFRTDNISQELHNAMREAWDIVRDFKYPHEVAMRTLQKIKNAENEHDISRALCTARRESA